MLIIVKKMHIFYVLLAIVICFLCFFARSAISAAFSTRAADYSIIVQIDEKKLFLFRHDSLVKEYSIASGKPGWPSPIGEWTIVAKSDWGKGFGGRWLGLNVPWGNYGIHGTLAEHLIGQAVSHGCIRMLSKDIRELYDTVEIGTPVVVRNGPYGPFGTGFRNLIPGDTGADVLAVQRQLRKLGYYAGKENGIYEDNLKYALYSFQRENKLTIKYTITREDYHAMGFREFD